MGRECSLHTEMCRVATHIGETHVVTGSKSSFPALPIPVLLEPISPRSPPSPIPLVHHSEASPSVPDPCTALRGSRPCPPPWAGSLGENHPPAPPSRPSLRPQQEPPPAAEPTRLSPRSRSRTVSHVPLSCAPGPCTPAAALLPPSPAWGLAVLCVARPCVSSSESSFLNDLSPALSPFPYLQILAAVTGV